MGFVKKWGLFLLLVFVLVFGFGYVWSFVFGFAFSPFQLGVETRFLPGEYETSVSYKEYSDNSSLLVVETVLHGVIYVSSFEGGVILTPNVEWLFPMFIVKEADCNCNGFVGFDEILYLMPLVTAHRLDYGVHDVYYEFKAKLYNASVDEVFVSGWVFIHMDYQEPGSKEILIREYYSELVLNGSSIIVRDTVDAEVLNTFGLGDLVMSSFQYSLFSVFLVKVLDVIWGSEYRKKAWAVFSRKYHEFKEKSGTQD